MSSMGSKDRQYKRELLYQKQNGVCKRCKISMNKSVGWIGNPSGVTLDHKIPKSKWPPGKPGLNRIKNLQAICWTCNSLEKRDIVEQEWEWQEQV